MTNDSMQTIYFGGPAKHGELSITGDVILNLRSDGSLTKSYRDARYHYRKVEVYDRITKEKVNTVDLFSGDVDGCYSILQPRFGPGYVTATEVEDGVSRRTTGHREGRTIDRSKDGQIWNWWPRSKQSKTRFQCKNDTLTLGNRVYERIPAEGR